MRWFKHVSNARKDRALTLVRDEFGIEGYGRYFLILEIVAEGSRDDQFSVSMLATEWASSLGCKQNKLQTFLSRLADVSLMNWERTGNVITIEVPKLAKIRDEYSRKTKKTPDNVRPRIDKRRIEEENKKESTQNSAPLADDKSSDPAQIPTPPPPSNSVAVATAAVDAFGREVIEAMNSATGGALRYTKTKRADVARIQKVMADFGVSDLPAFFATLWRVHFQGQDYAKNWGTETIRRHIDTYCEKVAAADLTAKTPPKLCVVDPEYLEWSRRRSEG